MWCQRKYHCVKQVPWTVNELACALLGIDADSLPPAARPTDAPPTRAPKRARAGAAQQQQQQPQSSDTETAHQRDITQEGEEVIAGTHERGVSRTSSLQLQHHVETERVALIASAHDTEETDEMKDVDVDLDEEGYAGGSEAGEDEFASLARKSRRLHRIRQFVAASKSPQDRLGRKCSSWSINNGYCAAGDRFLIPNKISDSREAMRFLRESSLEVIKDSCRGLPTFGGNSVGKCCGSRKRFACMERGDMIAMLVPGPVGQGEAYFGVISSNDLVLLNPAEAEERGFPAMHLLSGGVLFHSLMLREVRWMRKGYVRDLPGQKEGMRGANSCPWLVESGPSWFVEPSKTQPALDMIKGRDFMQNTESLGRNLRWI